eukprot:2119057-Prymnesium_polylepis.1
MPSKLSRTDHRRSRVDLLKRETESETVKVTSATAFWETAVPSTKVNRDAIFTIHDSPHTVGNTDRP